MKYIRIKTEDDIEILKPMFRVIFPEESVYDFRHYYDSLRKPHKLFDSLEYYFMVYDGNKVGICNGKFKVEHCNGCRLPDGSN